MIKILDYTKNPLQCIGDRASVCWNNTNFSPEKLKQIAIDSIDSGHGRVLEFPDITILISEYSARMIRELYTHIGGDPTRLQESTRYVDMSNFEYYIPDSIKINMDAQIVYQDLMEEIAGTYEYLINECKIPKQDVANILPLGSHTKVVLKINLRALMHMAEIRMCNRALKEYRDFMDELKNTLKVLDSEWDYICTNYMLPKCEIYGFCNEKNSCGRYQKKV